MKAYYKTNAPEVMAALEQHKKEVDVIRDAGLAFAKKFGGQLLARNDTRGYQIAGLVFEPRKPSRLWTHPADCGEQRPRQTVVKATVSEKAELAVLKASWKASFPTQESNFEPVMAAMGTSWGNCVFAGFGMFEHDGHIYVATGAKLAPCMVEILASEYGTARVAFDVAQNAARKAVKEPS